VLPSIGLLGPQAAKKKKTARVPTPSLALPCLCLGLGLGEGEASERARVCARVWQKCRWISSSARFNHKCGSLTPRMLSGTKGTVGDAFKVTWSKETFFRENRVFWVQNGPKWSQNGPKGGPLGAPEGQFWVFEAPRPFGGS
jgi:hypothetical protein